MSSARKKHRGPHPGDLKFFGEKKHVHNMQKAASELTWLFNRGYPPRASLKLVGDHNRLNKRQRMAVSRATCSNSERENRENKRITINSIKGKHLFIDGFNLIITLESALGGGVILLCRDGCYRDLSGIHGSYRQVEDTQKVIHLIGQTLAPYNPTSVTFLFDKPVSNSLKLSGEVLAISNENNWPFQAEAVYNPDKDIIDSNGIAISSDSYVIDNAKGWINLTEHILNQHVIIYHTMFILSIFHLSIICATG